MKRSTQGKGARSHSALHFTQCEHVGDGYFLAWQSSDTATFKRMLYAVKGVGGEWQNLERVWWVGLHVMDALCDEIPELAAYMAAQREEPQEEPPRRRADDLYAPGEALALLHVTPDAPVCVVKAAYRALAKQLHPDTGASDLEAMKRLNLAYEAALAWAEAHGGQRAA